jgi:flagellar protein FliO/FliZ
LLRYFLFLLLPLKSSAAETAAPVISAGSYLQTGLALGLIVTLLIGGAWLAKKLSGGKGFGQGGMKIIGGVALGPRERIVLIEVGEEWLVVGIVPGQIRTLHRLARGSTTANDTTSATQDQPFSQWLQSITERRKHD